MTATALPLTPDGFAFGGAFSIRQPGTTAAWKTKVQNFSKCPYMFRLPELKIVLAISRWFIRRPADAKPLLAEMLL